LEEAEPNTKDVPLHIAALEHKAEIVLKLLEAGANSNALNEHQLTPLHIAGDLRVFQILVEHGANVNAKAVDGSTPIMRASSHEEKKDTLSEAVKYLLSKGNYPFFSSNINPSKEQIFWTKMYSAKLHSS